jgi:hypothetical protein
MWNTHEDLPPVDHSQGFTTREEICAYLAAFADRPDADIASFDLWGRPTTFGDMRKLTKESQQTMSFNFD